MPKHLHHLFAEIYNRPQLILPSYAEVFNGALQGRFGIESLINHEGLEMSAAAMQQRALDYEPRYEKEYFKETRDGIAVIPIRGTLVSRGGVYPSSGITTYSGLRQRLKAAANDNSIRGILLDIDSPGGSATNVEETAELIREISQSKTIWALAYNQMTSGAYWLASAASRIIATKDASVGSVGVLVMHADYSKMLDNEGVTINFIHAGARKVEGNAYEPLPEELRERIQSDVNDTYELFTRRVAEYRGITQQAVKNTEAGVFSAAQGITHNLVDEVLAADDVLQKFADHLNSGGSAMFRINHSNPQGASLMNDKPKETSSNKTSPQLDGSQVIKGVLENAAEAVSGALQELPAEPQKADAADLLELCEGQQFGFMASTLIKSEVTKERAEAQLAEAGKIRDVLAAAGLEEQTETIIKSCGTLVEGVHQAIAKAITETRAAADPEQDSYPNGDNGKGTSAISAQSIYQSRHTN